MTTATANANTATTDHTFGEEDEIEMREAELEERAKLKHEELGGTAFTRPKAASLKIGDVNTSRSERIREVFSRAGGGAASSARSMSERRSSSLSPANSTAPGNLKGGKAITPRGKKDKRQSIFQAFSKSFGDSFRKKEDVPKLGTPPKMGEATAAGAQTKGDLKEGGAAAGTSLGSKGADILQQGKKASRLKERTSTADLQQKGSGRARGTDGDALQESAKKSTRQLRLDGERRIDGTMRVLDLVAMWEDDIDRQKAGKSGEFGGGPGNSMSHFFFVFKARLFVQQDPSSTVSDSQIWSGTMRCAVLCRAMQCGTAQFGRSFHPTPRSTRRRLQPATDLRRPSRLSSTRSTGKRDARYCTAASAPISCRL